MKLDDSYLLSFPSYFLRHPSSHIPCPLSLLPYPSCPSCPRLSFPVPHFSCPVLHLISPFLSLLSFLLSCSFSPCLPLISFSRSLSFISSPLSFLQSIGISAAPKFQPAATSARSTPVMGLSSLGPTVSSIAKGSASTSTSAQRIGNQRAPEVSKVSMSIVDLGREDGDGEGDGDAAWGTDDDLDFDE